MAIAALIKSIPDPEAPAGAYAFSEGKVDLSRLPYVLGPFEGNALELSLRLGELAGKSVTAVAMGGVEQEKGLRRALAAGADTAVRIEASESWASPLTHARRLAAGLQKLGPMDFIVCGRQAGDFDYGVTAGLLSGLLGLPLVPLVRAVHMADGRLFLEREAAGGSESGWIGGACVMSATNGPGTLLRVPKVRNIMQANRKPIERVSVPSDEGPLALDAFEERRSGRAGRKVSGSVEEVAGAFVDALLDLGALGR